MGGRESSCCCPAEWEFAQREMRREREERERAPRWTAWPCEGRSKNTHLA